MMMDDGDGDEAYCPPGMKGGKQPFGGKGKKKAKKRKKTSAKEADQKAGASLKKDLFETFKKR